jgi:hypothetical protein
MDVIPMPPSGQVLEIALQYHTHGWSIIPVKPGHKKPACKSWKPYQFSVSVGEGATFAAGGGQVSGYVMRREMQRGQVDRAHG